MIELQNQTNLTLTLSKLEEIATTLTTQEIELMIVSDNTMQALNHTHRGKDSSTDVLSFPLDYVGITDEQSNIPLGSIVISANYVEEKAIHYGHTEQEELSLLFIHGLLHLLGYDHESDHGKMRQKEASLIQYFNLPKSLIVRTHY